MAKHTVMDERTKAALKTLYKQGLGGAEDVELDFGDEDSNEPAWYELDPQEEEPVPTTFLRYTCKAGANVLYDSVGEWLAAFFGITTPRYQYVINDIIARQQEAVEETEAYDRQVRCMDEERARQMAEAENQAGLECSDV